MYLMRKRWFLFWLSIIVIIVVAILLLSGSEILVKPVLKDSTIPWGTLLTWLGMVALPSAIYLGLKKIHKPITNTESFIRIALKTTIWLAILWVPISYLLSGNLAFTFSNKPGFQGGQTAMKLFWYYNIYLVVYPLVLLLIYFFYRLFSKK